MFDLRFAEHRAHAHFSNLFPIAIDRAENVVVRGNTLYTLPRNHNIVVSKDSRNIEIGINRYWQGLSKTGVYTEASRGQELSEHGRMVDIDPLRLRSPDR